MSELRHLLPRPRPVLLLAAALVVSGGVVFASEAPEPDVAGELAELRRNLDFIWILVAAALVFVMQAGFMCLESGLARAKNSINVSIKNMGDLVLSITAFYLFGFGLMFGASKGGLFGTTDFLVDPGGNAWIAAFFVFQAMFCGTAATIDSGAIAERTRFGAYLLLSALTSAVLYPIMGHWAWGSLLHGGDGGWLEQRGFVDFAGSTVVHSVGGWVALAAVLVIGPRLGKFDEDGRPRKIGAHNLPMAYLGTFILFYGWFGFNCGSTFEATTDVAQIALNTIVAACLGGITAGAASWVLGEHRLPEAEMIMNGVLGGLVAITAGCASVSSVSACAIGAVGGIAVYFSVRFIERVLRLDDVVGAISVHGVAGAWGTLAVGFFMRPEFLAATGNSRVDQIGAQLLGVVACFGWTFGVCYLVLRLVRRIAPLRVSPEDEEMGLNVAEHGASSSLLELASSMQAAVEKGVYDESLFVAEERGTEIGDLAGLFNEMIRTISAEQRRSRRAIDRIRDMHGKIDSICRRSSIMEESLQETAKSAEGMVASVGEVLSTMDGLARSFEEIVTRSSDAAGQVRVAVTQAEESRDSVNELGDYAGSIDEILEVLASLAHQTRMLAFNANIEAGRAGEAGVGFAVVADEVKELAGRSNESTRHIGHTIETINSKIGRTAASIDDLSSIISNVSAVNLQIVDTVEVQRISTADSIRVVGETAHLLSDLVAGIQSVCAGVHEVAEAVTETFEGFEEIYN